ncbi:MAG: GntR family transcriptional regulator [Acidobacteria bacterium]|nr:GntR family transcriptional regulator [Acidobacteriota bacterium]
MEADLTLAVEWGTAEPVYEQIARQLRTLIAAGDLRPGSPLPAVRTLASDLGVNLNTVARAYRLLADHGFVLIRDRAGAEVAAPAVTPDPGSLAPLWQELREVLLKLRQAGVTADEVRRAIASVVAPTGGETR